MSVGDRRIGMAAGHHSAGEASFPLSFLSLDRHDKAKVAIATRVGDAWETVNYGQLLEASAALAQRLSDCIQPGDRVVLRAPSSGAWVAGFIGILRAGGIAVPVDPASTDAEVSAFLRLVMPTAVVDLPGLPSCSALDALPRLVPDPKDSTQTVWVDRSRPLSAVAMIVATSGTSGGPKAVALSRGNLEYMVNTLTPLQQAVEDDVWLSVLPLSHMLEVACAVLPALKTGATVYFAQSLVPGELISIMHRFGVTKMMTVPLLLGLFQQQIARKAATPPGSLQTLYCGGAPLEASVGHFFEQRGVSVYSGYGLTETSPTVAVNYPRSNRFGSVGRVLPETELRVDSSTGELLVRGPGVMTGYWNGGLDTANPVSGGWFPTGDIGEIDEDGFVYITGRIKNLIVLPSGAKVQPEEVEAVLDGCELWHELAIAGSDEVCAIVYAGEGVDSATVDRIESEIAGRCLVLSWFKRPARIVFIPKPIPRKAKGSIDRSLLADLILRETATPGV